MLVIWKTHIIINNSETNLSCQSCGQYFTESNPFFNISCLNQDSLNISSLKIQNSQSGDLTVIINNTNNVDLSTFFCNVNNLNLYNFNNILSLELKNIPQISTTSLNDQPIQIILRKIKDDYSQSDNINLQK